MIVGILAAALALQQLAAQEFTLRETAGIRRTNYPVRTNFPSQADPDELGLLDDTQSVPAQFTAIAPGLIELDFNASLLPWEVRVYRVAPGKPTRPSQSTSFGERENLFSIRHPSDFEFTVPKNLFGLLDDVRHGRHSYLVPGSFGLGLIGKNENSFRVGGFGASGAATVRRVAKAGPAAVRLRFDTSEALGGSFPVHNAVELDFPAAKSWMEVRWTVDDPDDRVSGMFLDLNLLLSPSGISVDFGAGSWLYTSSAPDQSASFEASPRTDGDVDWKVEAGGGSFASGRAPRVEGWVQVGDDRQTTVLAVSGFGQSSRADRIEVLPEGRLRFTRDGMSGGSKQLRFWLHFVRSPVHRGAATGPQAMLSPLQVVWK